MVIVDAAPSPVPSPATPSPGTVINQQSPYADADSEADERRRHNGTRTWSSVDHRRVILGYVNDLWVYGLNGVYGLTIGLLHINLLLLVAAQGARSIGLRAQPLDRGGYLGLIGRDRLSNRGVVVDVLCHHLQHSREGDQRNKCRIESLLLGGIGERGTGEALVIR